MANLAVITHEIPQKHEAILSSAISQEAYKFNIDSLPDTYKKDILKSRRNIEI